jgi:hypothetical protein
VKPRGIKEHTHSNYMRLLKPANDATIIGEAGDNIGRGGRTSLFFVDEAAYLERPPSIEAALSATCASTSHRRASARSSTSGPLRSPLKFIFDVADAPWHTPEWVQVKREELEGKGLGYIFGQKFLRDGTAGIEGQLIPGEWVQAAVGAAVKLGINPSGETVAALDVGGQDRSALTVRHGIEVSSASRG